MLCRPTSNLSLYRIEGLQRDNCFVSILGVVLRQLPVIDERPLGKIILSERGLKQMIASVGIIA